MGVPVVTLRGDRHAGRVGASLLTAVGLEELIAEDPESYVAITTSIAHDLDRLAILRANLRERVRASPLCDGPSFAREMEAAYRTAWRRWCADRAQAIASAPGSAVEHAVAGKDALLIRLRDGVTLAVPASLDAITSYVLLEQETWFEKEITFVAHWLKPGMTVIDIGANLGVYTLPMARRVGPNGRVYAYEPGSEARHFLERSREQNSATNLQIISTALSDRERDGRLVFGTSSELNALGESGTGETVHITSLDLEEAARGWASPDFIKIDAEGEEERILAGGRDFFARHSPLVMFEVKAGATVNESLRAAFPAIGYRLYRLLEGAPILVPLDPMQSLDGFELNLFAAKPDRARSLQDDNVLGDVIPTWEPDSEAVRNSLSLLKDQVFAHLLGPMLGDGSRFDADYIKALAAYAVWRTVGLPATTRCSALAFAYRMLAVLCTRAPTIARLSTFARVTWECGARSESLAVLNNLLERLKQPSSQLSEPFWPPCPRYDALSPGQSLVLWLEAAIAEQLERTQTFSSYFRGETPRLSWLCAQPFASAEMERRRILVAARAGLRPTVPSRLRQATHDHLNAEIWRDGLVPIGIRHFPNQLEALTLAV